MFFSIKKLFINLFFLCNFIITSTSFAQKASTIIDSISLGNSPYIENKVIENNYILPFVKADIDSIITDCSCLTLDIQKHGSETIAVGQFSPYKPGFYEKSWTIILKDKSTHQLKMTGQLTTQRATIESTFKYKNNGLSFESKQIDFGKINREGIVSKKVTFHNHSLDTLHYSRNNSPENIEMVFPKNVILPNSNNTFTLYLNPKDTIATHLGYNDQFISLILKTNNGEIVTPLSVSSTIVPAPFFIKNNYGKISVSTLVEESLRIKEGDEIIKKISIRNNGNSPLHIHYFEINNGVEILSKAPITINPMEVISISFKVLDIGRTGKQSRSFNIYSDDAQNPVSEVVYKFRLKKIKS